MHYYNFNIADYRKDTVHLSPIEHYIYRTLIDMYYLDEKPIPKETQWVMRRLNLANPNDEMALKNVLNDFFYESDDGFRHERIDIEIEKYQASVEKNRKNGKKGGRPPKNKPKITQWVSDGLPNESQINPNQEPITNNQEPITNNQELTNESVIEEEKFKFDDFWNLYNKKVGKAHCEKKWSKLTNPEKELILQRLPAYIAVTQDVQYRKNPLTYLNGRHWEDEIVSSNSNGKAMPLLAPANAPVVDISKRFAHLKKG